MALKDMSNAETQIFHANVLNVNYFQSELWIFGNDFITSDIFHDLSHCLVSMYDFVSVLLQNVNL